jgi:hypothetical protein
MRRALSLSFVICALIANVEAQGGQPQAGVSARQKQIEQGKEVIFTVKLSPTPTVGGSVWVHAAPASEPTKIVQGQNGVSAGQSSTEMGATIPIDGKPGPWKVVSVYFQPPNGGQTELTLTDTATFEVVKREVVLPKTADVQVK